MSKKDKNFAAIIAANQTLQTKAGTGTIPSSTIKKCQALLDNNTYDFTPIGQSMLDRLHTLIQKTRKGALSDNQAIEKILECIMQLKANGSMFQYKIVSNLSEAVMEMIEPLAKLDTDALDIIEALHTKLTLVFEKKIKDSDLARHKHIERELKALCIKYSQHKTNT